MEKQIESLKIKLNTITGKEKVDVLNELSALSRAKSPQQAIDYANQALEECSDYPKGQAKALNNSGIAWYYMSDYEKALENFLHSLKISTSLPDDLAIAKSYNNIGNAYLALGNYHKCLKYYSKSLEIRGKLDDKSGIADTLSNIGVIYRRFGDDEKSLEFYLKALKIREELQDQQKIADSLSNIALIYQDLENYGNALDYHEKALKIRTELEDNIGVSISLNNIGILHRISHNYPQALECHLKSLDIEKKINEKTGIARSYNNIGIIYEELDDLVMATKYNQKALDIYEKVKNSDGILHSLHYLGRIKIKSKNFDEGHQLLERCLQLAKKTDSKKVTLITYLSLSELFSETQNYKEALRYHKLYSDTNDQLQAILTKEKIAEMKLRYDVEKKEKEAEIYRLKNIELAKKNTLITEQKNQLTSALAKLQRLEKAIETTEVGVTITDCDGKIIYTNPADAEMHGFTVKELIGRKSNIFTKPELRKTKTFSDVGVSSNWKRERINLRKDGTTFPVELISNIIKDLDEKPIGRVTICENITERKEAEENLVKSEQQLRHLNAMKDKFFSIISHDLKGSFNAIMSGSTFLAEKIESMNKNDAISMAKSIKTSSEAAFKLLINLLTWSRLQRGKISFNPTTFNIKNLVTKNCLLLSLIAKQKSIELLNSIDGDYHAFGDYEMINTVIRNLISNALKFTPSQGQIKVGAKIVDSSVQISIKDNGVGIPQKYLKELFRIDSNFGTNGTEGERGTGLGLILCKEFVEKNQGKIWVESSVGDGSIFYFTLPTGDNVNLK